MNKLSKRTNKNKIISKKKRGGNGRSRVITILTDENGINIVKFLPKVYHDNSSVIATGGKFTKLWIINWGETISVKPYVNLEEEILPKNYFISKFPELCGVDPQGNTYEYKPDLHFYESRFDFCPDGKYMVTSYRNGFVLVWSISEKIIEYPTSDLPLLLYCGKWNNKMDNRLTDVVFLPQSRSNLFRMLRPDVNYLLHTNASIVNTVTSYGDVKAWGLENGVDQEAHLRGKQLQSVLNSLKEYKQGFISPFKKHLDVHSPYPIDYDFSTIACHPNNRLLIATGGVLWKQKPWNPPKHVVQAFATKTYEYSGVLVLALNGEKIYENRFAHEHRVTCIAFHSTLNMLVTGSRNACLKFWSYNYKKDVEFDSSSFTLNEKKKLEIPECSSSITSIVFHPGRPDIMATSTRNGMIKLWHLTFTEEDIIIDCLETIDLINHIVFSVTFHPFDNMNYLLIGSYVVKLPNGWSYSFVRDDQEKHEENTVRCINESTGESRKRYFPPETNFSGSLNLCDFSEIISKILPSSQLSLTNTSILSSDLSQPSENVLQSTVSAKDTSASSKLKSEKDSLLSIHSLESCEGKNRMTCPKTCKWIQNKCVKKGGVYRKQPKK